MHPIWFTIWVWEKAWSADGLFPLIEHNQGSIAVVTLIVAVVFALVEQKRATDAQISARADAQAAEERDRAAALKSEERAREAAADAEAREREAQRERERAVLRSFASAIDGLLRRAIDLLKDGSNLHRVGERVRFPTAIFTTETEIAESLAELMRAAPLDAETILSLRKAIRELRTLGMLEALGSGAEPEIMRTAGGYADAIEKRRLDVAKQHRRMIQTIKGPKPARPVPSAGQ